MKKILLLALPLIFLFPDLAHAASTTQDEIYESLATLLGLFINLLNQFLWPFLLLIGGLMENDMITGPGMLERLRFIYVQVRDLVNIAFAVFLLFLAIYNSLPFADSDGNSALKNALPRLILGIVLVNFTFMLGRVVIDMSNVATTAVFALPEAVEGFDFEKERTKMEENLCAHEATVGGETVRIPWSATTDGGIDNIPTPTTMFCALKVVDGEEVEGEYTGEITPYIANNYFSRLNSSNVALVMAVNMGSIDELGLLKAEDINGIKDLLTNGFFSLILYVVFALSYLVLALVLIARIVVLWLALAFSPVAVLTYVIPEVADSIGEGGGDIVGQVTKHLMAPIIIGVTLTVGYLMISAYSDFSAGFGGAATSINSIQSGVIAQDFLVSGITDLERLIIALATIVVLWTGIFAAADGTLAAFATDTIKELGGSAGAALARAPLLLPTIPISTPGGDGIERVSPLAYFGLADKALKALSYGDAHLRDDYDVLQKKFPGIKKLLGDSDLKTPNQRGADIQRMVSDSSGRLGPDQVRNIAKMLFESGKTHGASTAVTTKLEELSKKENITDSDFGDLKRVVRDNEKGFGMDEKSFKTMVQEPLSGSEFDPNKKSVAAPVPVSAPKAAAGGAAKPGDKPEAGAGTGTGDEEAGETPPAGATPPPPESP